MPTLEHNGHVKMFPESTEPAPCIVAAGAVRSAGDSARGGW